MVAPSSEGKAAEKGKNLSVTKKTEGEQNKTKSQRHDLKNNSHDTAVLSVNAVSKKMALVSADSTIMAMQQQLVLCVMMEGMGTN